MAVPRSATYSSPALLWVQGDPLISSRTKLEACSAKIRWPAYDESQGIWPRATRCGSDCEFTDPRQYSARRPKCHCHALAPDEPQQQVSPRCPQSPSCLRGSFETAGGRKLSGYGDRSRCQVGPAVGFTVKVSGGNSALAQMDSSELECAAVKTRGHFYRWSNAGSLLGDLPAGRHVAMKQTAPPWFYRNRWPVLLLLLIASLGSGRSENEAEWYNSISLGAPGGRGGKSSARPCRSRLILTPATRRRHGQLRRMAHGAWAELGSGHRRCRNGCLGRCSTLGCGSTTTAFVLIGSLVVVCLDRVMGRLAISVAGDPPAARRRARGSAESNAISEAWAISFPGSIEFLATGPKTIRCAGSATLRAGRRSRRSRRNALPLRSVEVRGQLDPAGRRLKVASAPPAVSSAWWPRPSRGASSRARRPVGSCSHVSAMALVMPGLASKRSYVHAPRGSHHARSARSTGFELERIDHNHRLPDGT